MSSKKEYARISEKDINSFLKNLGFQKMDVEGISELVYGKRVDKNGKPLSLRVYTSISSNGQSRDCGNDAIRVELFWWNPNTKKVEHVGHGKRVNRIQTWKKNLKKRIQNVGDLTPMVLRNGSNGKFWGCPNYPKCDHTKNYN